MRIAIWTIVLCSFQIPGVDQFQSVLGQTENSAVANQKSSPPAEKPIDFEKARGLFRKRAAGEKLTPDEQSYLQRAIEARQANNRQEGVVPRDKTNLVPLNEMTDSQRYKGEDGGLYGGGQNEPPDKHRRAALVELGKIRPLDRSGQPASDGRVVFVSISMSNATQEFSAFKQIADMDSAKSQKLTIVDCAQGGQAMAEWVDPAAQPWEEAKRRIKAAGVSDQQVQVAWIKLANKGPRGELAEHGRKLQRDTLAVIHNAQRQFPNLKIVYLASRIYGGYANSPLNPEPFAYESAFAARWLIQDQINGHQDLNYNAEQGEVKAPLLLWGPYFWADGVTPRKSDMLVWNRDDLAADGTHPSPTGRKKVAQMLLQFFRDNELAKSWFRE